MSLYITFCLDPRPVYAIFSIIDRDLLGLAYKMLPQAYPIMVIPTIMNQVSLFSSSSVLSSAENDLSLAFGDRP